MDPKTLVYLAMVYLWFSLHTGRMLLIVAAQSNLSAVILTLESNRKEGGQVQMICTATNYDFQNYILEWQKDGITLKRNEETVKSDPRLSFSTVHKMNMVTTELLGITDVLRDDSGTYMCNAVYNGTSTIVSTVQVTLSVLYFPSESFPICSPAEPNQAAAGTELNLQCSSEVGNPQVVMEIYQTIKYNGTLTLSHHGDMISTSLALIAHVDYKNVQFLCTITSPMYYPNMNRTCIIGPINISNVTEQNTTPIIESTHLTSPTTYPSHNETTAAPIVAGAVAGVVVLIVIIILIIVCRRRHGLCKMKQSSDNNTSIKIPTKTASTRNNNSEPSQPNFNNDNGHGHKHDTHNQAADKVSSPAPESSSSHSGMTLPRRAEVPDSGVIYAKPQKATVRPDNPPSVTAITEQSYTNPIFDSKGIEDTTRPFKDHPKSFIKPMAKVQPNIKVPKKPAPCRTKSDRTSYTHDNPITSPSRDHTEPPSGHPQDGRQETSSPPSDVTYAQVSVPIRQNSSSSQKPGDDITYAELDLTSHTTQDDEVAPASSTVGPIIYATVSKTKNI